MMRDSLPAQSRPSRAGDEDDRGALLAGLALALAEDGPPGGSSSVDAIASRMSATPDGTRALLEMRRDLIDAPPPGRAVRTVRGVLDAALATAFEPDRLVFRPIDQASPVPVLEHVMRNEAVHPVAGWSDLRSRLDPQDRRCFGYFHPALADRPVAFVEVALTENGASSIAPILDRERAPLAADRARVAVFFSVSSVEPGLRGIPLGGPLIKRALQELSAHRPRLGGFATLSPIPGLRQWLRGDARAPGGPDGAEVDRARAALERGEGSASHRATLHHAAEEYLLATRPSDGRPVDPVARFHIGNGARLTRILVEADPSPSGRAASYGVMARYEYERPRA